MNIIYERIITLCRERNTTYNAVCKELGIRPSVIGNLKSRENSVMKADNTVAFANYFGVSPDYLLGITDNRNIPQVRKDISEEDIRFALFGGQDVTDAKWEEVKRFAEFIKNADR